MNELRDILHQRHHEMAASLRDADEFDATAAARAVRTHRRGRAIVMGSSSLAVVAVITAGAWMLMPQGAPTIVPVAVPSTSASPTPAATPSASVTPSPEPVVYEGRNPGMSDEEALYRAEHPATGEVWLDEPVQVDPPADFEWNSWQTWFHVGDRGEVRIYRTVSDVSFDQAMFEQGPDGVVSRVLAPRPSDPLAADGDDSSFPGAETTDAYYDSLALPSTWTTPEGVPVSLGDHARGVYDYGGERVDTLGQTEVWRYLSLGTGHAREDGVASVHALAYYLADPAGGLYTVGAADPLGTAADPIDFTAPGVGEVEQHYIELTDSDCSGTAEYTAVASGTPDAWWTPVGSTPTAQLFAPTADNPIATTLYATWDASFAPSPGALSFADYLDAPAILATPAPAGDLWFLELGTDYRVRAWC